MLMELLEEHECFGGDVFDHMIRLLVDEILFEHIDLIVFQHSSFCDLTKSLNLSGKALVFIDFFHESGVLLGLSRVYCLWPPSLAMVHAFISCADPIGVDLVQGQVSDVVELDKVGISEDIVFVFEMIFGGGVEGGADGGGVCEGWRSS